MLFCGGRRFYLRPDQRVYGGKKVIQTETLCKSQVYYLTMTMHGDSEPQFIEDRFPLVLSRFPLRDIYNTRCGLSYAGRTNPWCGGQYLL